MGCLFVVFLLLGGLLNAAEILFERHQYTSEMKIGSRPRAAAHAEFFAEMQPYDLYNNYLDEWNDRPLYLDSSGRSDPWKKQEWSYLRDAEIIREFEISGMTFFIAWHRTSNHLKSLARQGVTDLRFLPIMGGNWKKWPEGIREMVRNKQTLRINGKIPLFTYGINLRKPENLKMLQQLRKDFAKEGITNLAFCNFFDLMGETYGEYRRTGAVSQKTIRKKEQALREYLSVLDGLQLSNYTLYRDPRGDHSMQKQFHYELDRKYLAPLVARVFAEPANRGKFLCVSLRQAYICDIGSGVNEAENGTSQLRNHLDSALLYNPDFFNLVEWNEVNENTCFQPTVQNGRTIPRIIRYYARFLKGSKPAPCRGDDESIPNLAVSVRWSLQLGERYRIELLNIPDTDKDYKYEVTLSLLNQDGRLLKKFSRDVFTADRMTAVTYLLPSEQLFGLADAVVPSLDIRYKGRTFTMEPSVSTRLSATDGYNQKELRIALRDQLQPRKADFKVLRGSKGDFEIIADIAAGEPLASLEVNDREYPVAAAWNKKDFDPDRFSWIVVKCHAHPSPQFGKWYPVKLQVKNAPGWVYRDWSRPYANNCPLKKASDGSLQRDKVHFWHCIPYFMVGIPHSQMQSGEIEYAINDWPSMKFSTADILKRRKMVFEPGGCIQVEIELRDSLPDHPPMLRTSHAAIRKNIHSCYSRPMFQICATTVSGRIYRSRPVFPVARSQKKRTLDYFSVWQRKAARTQVEASEIPNISYRFLPELGGLLTNSSAPEFDAVLGGGFTRGLPFQYVKLPEKTERCMPEWEGSMLGFRKGSYLTLPRSSMPAGAFTLEFEIMPDHLENQHLFALGNFRQGGIECAIIYGRLFCSYATMAPAYGHRLQAFPTTLKLEAGKWNKVKIVYDLKKLNMSVNGKAYETACDKRPCWAISSVFGNYLGKAESNQYNPGPYEGKLRALRIVHAAEK